MSRRPKDKRSRGNPVAPPVRTAAAPAGMVAPPHPPDSASAWLARCPDWLVGLLLVAATFVAYAQLWQAGFIWDDDAHVTRPNLYSLHGLLRIWSEPGATQQYYPVLHSAFWVEHRLWGDSALGYHLANLLLHSAAAFLLYRVLRRLDVPGALLAAAVFALHPVCVETVAWISEQKNTLSAVLYFSAALAWFRYDRERRIWVYALATGLFVAALAAKSVTATLPAALLVVTWWKRGRLTRKGDVRPLLPWFVLSAGAGTMTAWMERTSIGASGAAYQLSLVERFLVAGRAVWFYLGKLLAPVDLIFIYPHWDVDARVAWQYLFPAALVLVLAVLFALRKRTRGPLAAALLFIATLFPALGFIDVFPFTYSYVADHFQYLAAAAMISAVAAGLALVADRLPRSGRRAWRIAAVGVVVTLAALTWRQSAMYAGPETLWRTTLSRNPGCWMACNNLGVDLLHAGRVDEAMANLERALEINPRNTASHTNLGHALLAKGRLDEAVAQYQMALDLDSGSAEAHTDLGAALLQLRRVDEAVSHLQRALAINPDLAKARFTLGNAFLQSGRADDAVAQYQRALVIAPGDAEAHTNLGTAFAQEGRIDEAAAEFETALVANPKSAAAHLNLGNALLQKGRTDAAIAHFQRALEIHPASAPTHNNLGLAFLQSGRVHDAVAHFHKALAINPGYAEAHRNLGTALFKQGRLDEADAEFEAAAKLK